MGIFIDSPDLANIKALAEQGDANAQYMLGFVLSGSAETEEDIDLMMSWYRKAALQGHPRGLWKIGVGYESDAPGQAVIWYRKSAEAGYSVAQWWLGVKYERGEGIEQDNGQALYWYKKAAEQGDASACYTLGRLYEGGDYVEQDWQQSADWYKRAAEKNAIENLDLSSCLEEAHGFMNSGTYRLPLHGRASMN